MTLQQPDPIATYIPSAIKHNVGCSETVEYIWKLLVVRLSTNIPWYQVAVLLLLPVMRVSVNVVVYTDDVKAIG